ncbi:MAG TPA: lipid-binding SYLF domain-containing protein [Aliidongia sp.]|nr:lipid-binding SYLF domain-containing protein [Aliidongia sp.]
MRKTILMAALAIAAFAQFAAPAARASDQQNLVEKSKLVIDDMKRDKEFGNARELLQRARGVLIVPSLVKGGFFVGGEGGEGVLLSRKGARSWSDPAFYTLASASFGLQIGIEQAELVLIIMNEKALNAVMQDEFKIGAQAGVAIATLGSTAEASTTSNLNADIVVWSSSSGAYAGITLNGSIIKPRHEWDAAYYGHATTTSDIVVKESAKNAGANGLRSELGSIS